EDGIRDKLVTGVQTCALPILLRDGKLVSALIVTTNKPHEWSEREITLVNIVAERTWLAVEKLRLDTTLRESDAILRDADRRKDRSEEHTSELQSLAYLVCRLL